MSRKTDKTNGKKNMSDVQNAAMEQFDDAL